jgi:hypothetical protein
LKQVLARDVDRDIALRRCERLQHELGFHSRTGAVLDQDRLRTREFSQFGLARPQDRGLRAHRIIIFEACDLFKQVGTLFVIKPLAWDRLLKAGQSLDDVGAKEVVVAMGQRCSQIVHRRAFPPMAQTGVPRARAAALER